MHENDYQNSQMPAELEALLQKMRPRLPGGFAMRTRLRFERAVEVRRLRRFVIGAISLFVVASLLVWGVILNTVNIAGTVWNGLLSGIALIRTVISLWGLLPVIGGGFAMAVICVTLLLLAIVVRLDRPAFHRNNPRLGAYPSTEREQVS